jgi:hypothetical protein
MDFRMANFRETVFGAAPGRVFRSSTNSSSSRQLIAVNGEKCSASISRFEVFIFAFNAIRPANRMINGHASQLKHLLASILAASA